MKRKLQVLLMAVLVPLFNINGQDSVSCVHDHFLQEFQDSNSRKGDISNIISYGAKRFREKNPDLQLYPKPQPATPCEMCMTIDPSCFKSKYALPVIVHIVAQTNITNIILNRELPIQNIFSLFF
jgi:hypothetical protein